MRRSATLVLALLTSLAVGVVIYAIQPHRASPQAGADSPVDDLPGFATNVIVRADNRITFAQATPDGLRDVTIVWARGPAPRPAADDREVRAPSVPVVLDDGNHDGECDSRNRPEHRHAGETRHRQPELTALDAVNAA